MKKTGHSCVDVQFIPKSGLSFRFLRSKIYGPDKAEAVGLDLTREQFLEQEEINKLRREPQNNARKAHTWFLLDQWTVSQCSEFGISIELCRWWKWAKEFIPKVESGNIWNMKLL